VSWLEIDVGDIVEVVRHRSTRGTISPRGGSGGNYSVLETLRGRVVYVGPKFITIRTKWGYCESFEPEQVVKVEGNLTT